MAEITASMVKDLREQTGVGMMECKKALQESEGDLKRAVELLREKGAAKAVKKSGRSAKEGRIVALVTDDKKKGALVEVNSETDFAARNDKFVEFSDIVTQTVLENACQDAEALLALKPAGADSDTVQTLITDSVGVIGENIGVGRCITFCTDLGLIHTYIHPPGKVGVMVEMGCDSPETAAKPEVDELAHEICLQIAFSNPAGIDPSTIPADVIEAEKAVYRNQALQEGKPEKILDKIVEGRLKSFYKEHCLLQQGYVKEDKQSIEELIAETAKKVGGEIKIAAFARYQLGENAGGEEE